MPVVGWVNVKNQGEKLHGIVSEERSSKLVSKLSIKPLTPAPNPHTYLPPYRHILTYRIYRLSVHLTFLFYSTAGFVYTLCQRPALSRFRMHSKSLQFQFQNRLIPVIRQRITLTVSHLVFWPFSIVQWVRINRVAAGGYFLYRGHTVPIQKMFKWYTMSRGFSATTRTITLPQ